MKDTNLNKSMKHRTRIQRLTYLFQSKKAELAAGYQGYQELLGFVDQCNRLGITDRGQEMALNDWIDLLECWPFVGGGNAGPLSHVQRQRTMVRDGFVCTMCGRPADEVHHKSTRSKGGRNRGANLTTLCVECHEKVHGARSGICKK
ncbi:MAG: HNH endonuclease [Methanosarcinales archaeon]|nr:HNH endonuclease [Methanosarcinales archaeon]